MSEKELGPGSFYATAPRAGGFHGLLSFGRGSLEKSTQTRISALLRSAPPSPPTDALTGPTWNPAPEVLSFGGGCAAVVRRGRVETSSGALLTEPVAASDATGLCILAPGSFISNADELSERYDDASPRAVAGRGPRGPGPAEPPADRRAAAAALILRLYSRDPDPLLVLSELQGQFAFCLLDADRRIAFAARDASGGVPLYYEIDADGGLSVASAPLAVPSEVGLAHWEALPPGHYVAGRPPALQQFALTKVQLAERRSLEASLEEECMSPRGRLSSTLGADLG